MQYSSAPPQVVQYAPAPVQMQYASELVQQQVVQYAPTPVQQEMMSHPVPKCAWDVRTVLVPKMVTEEYVEMQPRIVAIALNVPKATSGAFDSAPDIDPAAYGREAGPTQDGSQGHPGRRVIRG
jgi:hypothetical protein